MDRWAAGARWAEQVEVGALGLRPRARVLKEKSETIIEMGENEIGIVYSVDSQCSELGKAWEIQCAVQCI